MISNRAVLLQHWIMSNDHGDGPAAKRFPRERFTKALIAICETLDAHPVVEYHHKPRRSTISHLYPQGMTRARALELYAFGSWSRGAESCGDLDLFGTVSTEWIGVPTQVCDGEPMPNSRPPSFRSAAPHLFGRRPHVHILGKQDLLDMEQKEAVDQGVLIWAPGRDWRAAIQAIRPKPTASRAPRISDAFPLRIEQTGMTLLQVEKAVRAKEAGLLDWHFVPHTDSRHSSPDLTGYESMRLKTLDVREPTLGGRALACTRDVRKRLGAKAVSYWFGECGVWPEMFRRPGIRAIVITPKWSQRGPNGSVVVTKGASYTPKRAKEFEKRERNGDGPIQSAIARGPSKVSTPA